MSHDGKAGHWSITSLPRNNRSRGEHLLTVFWADHERSGALQILRTTLHGLRKDLGTGLLVDDNNVALAPDGEIDARLFEKHLEEAPEDPKQLAETIALYRGDFLANFLLPDTPAFEDWLVVEREHYRRLVIRGLGDAQPAT